LKNPRKAGSVICLCEHGAHCACMHASTIPKLNNGAHNTRLNQNISSRNSRNAYRYESSRTSYAFRWCACSSSSMNRKGIS
jgi:hypothetical protein